MKFLEYLLPREGKFHTLLNEMTSEASKACELLNRFVEAPESERSAISEQIRSIKKRAKQQMNEMHERLVYSFITPFDREDLQEFALVLYRIPKQVDKIRGRLTIMQNNGGEDPNMKRLLAIVLEESQALQFLVERLNKRDIHELRKQADKIQELEHEADEVLESFALTFNSGDANFYEALFRKDVYELLEKLTDHYKDGSDVAMRIILKHT